MGDKGTAPQEGTKAQRILTRVPLQVQVEIQCLGLRSVGRAEDISQGGLLVHTRQTFEVGAPVRVRFHLPGGGHVEAPGVVRNTKPGTQMGIQFLQLTDQDRRSIEQLVHAVKPYRRRSVRIPRQLTVVLRWQDLSGDTHEELGETVLLSRFGGLMVSTVRLKAGDTAYLWWPEAERGAPVRIVFRQLGGPADLTELAFEFIDADNFWAIEFPPDIHA